MPFNFLHDHWTCAVQDYLDGKPLLEVFTVQSFVDMMDLLPPERQSVLLIDKQGNQLTDKAVTSLRFEGGQDVVLPVILHGTLILLHMDRRSSCSRRLDAKIARGSYHWSKVFSAPHNRTCQAQACLL